MNTHLGFIFYANIICITLLYMYIFKRKKLIGFQQGMNISMVVGGMLSLVSGTILIYQFPLNFVFVTIITTLIGMITGSLFGGLFDYQTVLTGYANGLMIGIMSPMVGAAAQNNIFFLWFLESLLVSSCIFIVSSIKKS